MTAKKLFYKNSYNLALKYLLGELPKLPYCLSMNLLCTFVLSLFYERIILNEKNKAMFRGVGLAEEYTKRSKACQ